MSSVSDSIVPTLNMDFAVFVVHANESRLSINEDNAGIGYAKIYKALLRATGESCVRLFGLKCERCFLIENLYVRKDYDQPLDRSGYVIGPHCWTVLRSNFLARSNRNSFYRLFIFQF